MRPIAESARSAENVRLYLVEMKGIPKLTGEEEYRLPQEIALGSLARNLRERIGESKYIPQHTSIPAHVAPEFATDFIKEVGSPSTTVIDLPPIP